MNRLATLSLAALALVPAASAQMQPTTMRSDAVWARATTETITLDGVLDEPGWSQAESIVLEYGERAGDPGSGYVAEQGQMPPPDPLMADVKFLVRGNQLYVGATVQDESIGGDGFPTFDGFLMKFREPAMRNDLIREALVTEYFYAWMGFGQPPVPGDTPKFLGPYGDRSVDANVARWDAASMVDGTANDDSDTDESYTFEMRFDLDILGYDATQAGGDQVAFTFSVYDVDGFFPFNDAEFSVSRVWWQSPFGGEYGVGRVFVDPAVTVSSGALPGMPYDVTIAQGGLGETPTIDGQLDEPVWDRIEGFDIRFNDDDLRSTYPGVGALTSGQFQPEIDVTGDGNGDPRNDVVDPGDATVKWFYKGTTLYVGVDVRDAAISARDGGSPDFRDGFRLSLNDRVELQPNDHFLQPYNFDIYLDPNGDAVVGEELTGADPSTYAIGIDGSVNDAGGADTGYQIEFSIDLADYGYPADLGDRVLFVGATLYDYDLLDDPAASYGTRAWYFREGGADRAAAYAFLDPANPVAGEAGPDALGGIRLAGAAPNPFSTETTLRYALPEAGTASVVVFDLLGRRVAEAQPGAQAAGDNATGLRLALPAGVYVYRVDLDGASGQRYSATGRFTVVR